MSLAAVALGTSLLAVFSATSAHALEARDHDSLPFISDRVQRMIRPLDRFMLEVAVRNTDVQRASEAFNRSTAGTRERELLRAQKQGAEEALLATLSEGMTTVLALVEETVIQSKQEMVALLDRPDAFQRLVRATLQSCDDSTTIALTGMAQQLHIYERSRQLRSNIAVAIVMGDWLGKTEVIYRGWSKPSAVDPTRPSISELPQERRPCRSTVAPLDDLDAVIQ